MTRKLLLDILKPDFKEIKRLIGASKTSHEVVRAIARQEVQRMESPVFTAQTTDATPQVIATIEIDVHTTGILEVYVYAMDDVGTGGVTIKQIVRWMKTGSLTLGTPVDVLALETDFVGATVAINAASDNIEIEVAGTASNIINWEAEIKTRVIKATTLP